MKRSLGAVLAVMFVLVFGVSARAADDKDAKAILDKAIKALGGEEKLSQVKAASWKAKGKLTLNGNEGEFTNTTTVQGVDRFRSEFEGEFNGNKVTLVTILAKDKGWRQVGENKTEMDENMLANQKRSVYLQVVPMTLLPLKDKGFRIEAAGEKKIGDKPAVGIKATGPDGKDFTLFFDKDSGLPVLMVAKVVGFGGDEYTQETSFADYKEFAGIKRATKLAAKRDGEKLWETQITEFKVLDTVDPKTFEEPK